MTLPTFSVGPTLSWSVIKTANWGTRMQRSVSGREVRVADFTYPIWNYQLTWEVLRDAWDLRSGVYGIGPAFPLGYPAQYELANIVNFFNSVKGAAMTFQWNDPSDTDTSQLGPTTPGGGGTAQVLGVGDGVTTQFKIVGVQLSPVVPVVVRFVTPAAAYAIDYDNCLLNFTTAPGSGVTVSIGMTYNQRVRFKSDTLESEEFYYQLYQMKKLELESVIY